MSRKSTAAADSKPFKPMLIGLRGRVMIATAIIMIPICVLLLLGMRHDLRLAAMLRTDGHAAIMHSAVMFNVDLMAAVVGYFVFMLLLSAVMVNIRFLHPLRHLTYAASRLAEGKLDTRVDMNKLVIGEMQTLGMTLNRMADILGDLALTDSLTAIANRRQFDQVVAGEVKRSTRMKKGLALLLIDVDKFKDYNDLYGHSSGDTCLQQIAQSFQNCVRRPSDLVARYGGEEFAVLLPDTDEDGALAVATVLLDSIRDLNIPHEGWEKARVTISIGIAVSGPSSIIEPSILIERADQALYAAKQAGRDRVLVHAEARDLA